MPCLLGILQMLIQWSCSKSIPLQEGSGAANGADEALDNEPEGTAASAKTSSPEPSDGGTDKTLEGVVQVARQHSQQDSLTLCMLYCAGPLTRCNNQNPCFSLGCLQYALCK